MTEEQSLAPTPVAAPPVAPVPLAVTPLTSTPLVLTPALASEPRRLGISADRHITIMPLEMRQARFATAMRGFDKADVTTFLHEAAEGFDHQVSRFLLAFHVGADVGERARKVRPEPRSPGRVVQFSAAS